MTVKQVVASAMIISLSGAASYAAPPAAAFTQPIQDDSALIAGWFSDQFKVAVPFNSTAGNVVPQQVHLLGFDLGVEGVVSGTQLDTNALHALPTSVLSTSQISTFSRLPLGDVLGQAKIGLPFGFDAGVRFGGLPTTHYNKGSTDATIQNTIWGLDLRKALIEEGLIHPFGLTLDANFTRAKGSENITQSFNSNGMVNYGGTTYNDNFNGTANGRTDWDTKSVGLQAILDKTFLVLTPYIGVSANKNFGSVDSSITTTGTQTLNGQADPDGPIDVTGSSNVTPNRWDLRALAGLEFAPLPFFHLGLYGEYAGNQNLAASLGARIQFH